MKKDDKRFLNKNSQGFVPKRKIGDILKNHLNKNQEISIIEKESLIDENELLMTIKLIKDL